MSMDVAAARAFASESATATFAPTFERSGVPSRSRIARSNPGWSAASRPMSSGRSSCSASRIASTTGRTFAS